MTSADSIVARKVTSSMAGQLPGWISYHRYAVGNIFRDDRASSDHRISPNSHTRKKASNGPNDT